MENSHAAPKTNIEGGGNKWPLSLAHIQNIAKYQRAFLWLVLLNFIFLKAQIDSIAFASIIGIGFAFFTFKLAKAIDSSPLLNAILGLVPVVNLVTLFILNRKATKVLKENGVSVSLMGANKADLKRLEWENL